MTPRQLTPIGDPSADASGLGVLTMDLGVAIDVRCETRRHIGALLIKLRSRVGPQRLARIPCDFSAVPSHVSDRDRLTACSSHGFGGRVIDLAGGGVATERELPHGPDAQLLSGKRTGTFKCFQQARVTWCRAFKDRQEAPHAIGRPTNEFTAVCFWQREIGTVDGHDPTLGSADGRVKASIFEA